MKSATKLVEQALPREAVQAHRVLGLEVEGGFLHGLRFEFARDLNCLIGGRGAGKTTAFELLRWAIKGAPLDPATGQEKRESLRLLQQNLGEQGRVRVRIETKQGTRYTVERRLGAEARVLDEAGVPTDLELTHGLIFDLDVYSQNEIETLAQDPASQLRLLDRLAGPEQRICQERIDAVRQQIQQNTHLVHSLGEVVAQLEVCVKERAQVEAALRVKGIEGTGELSEVDAAILEKGAHQRESDTLEAVERFVGAARERIGSLGRLLRDGPAIAQGVGRGPNRDVIGELLDLVAGTCEEARRQLLALDGRLEGVAGVARRSRGALARRHRAQEARYRELIAANEREQRRASEQLTLERRLREIQVKERERDEKRAELEAARARRVELKAELSTLQDERFARRDAVARSISRRLEGQVGVAVRQGADRSAFRAVLAPAFKGVRTPYQALLTQLVDACTPGDLVAALESPDPKARLAIRLGADAPERVGVLVDQLLGTIYPLQAESADIEDAPELRLKDGRTWKPASDLSTGQKCTAVLPILLLESDRPLAVDQPEDNLDNAFVFEAVVSRLREVKEERQLILVTHNPNIPVLGDAARVFVLRSDGQQASLAAQGTVDEVREEVARLLEGGRAAFEARRERYGY